MIQETTIKRLAPWVTVICLCVFFLFNFNDNALGDEDPPVPEMPTNWKLISDFRVPTEQVKAMSSKLGADLTSVRNTIYDVDGKRVQINVLVTPDSGECRKADDKTQINEV